MGTPEAPLGPPCDFCPDFSAVGSIMNLLDYSTVRFCGNCGPGFLLGVVEAMTGAPAEQAGQEQPEQPAAAMAESEPELTDSAAGPDGDDDGQGSARDHWASTTHVRRSTHGHRTAGSKTGGERTDAGEPGGS